MRLAIGWPEDQCVLDTGCFIETTLRYRYSVDQDRFFFDLHIRDFCPHRPR